jgi:hypothetical protein
VEVADDRPEFLAAKAVGPGVEFVVRVVEVPGLEVPQRPKLGDGLVSKFAVELDVMIMLAGRVVDLELPGQVQREDGWSLEGVKVAPRPALWAVSPTFCPSRSGRNLWPRGDLLSPPGSLT